MEDVARVLLRRPRRELIEGACAGVLWRSRVRSVCWRALLAVLPERPDEWAASARAARGEYAELLSRQQAARGRGARAAVPRRASEGGAPPPRPPRPEAGGCWDTLYLAAGEDEAQGTTKTVSTGVQEGAGAADGEALRVATARAAEAEIWKDVVRTRTHVAAGPEAEALRQRMLRVLLVWACAHPDVGYKQGMNELLAVIIAVLDHEYTRFEREHGGEGQGEGEGERFDALLAELTDRAFLEHDAYALLGALLARLAPLYAPDAAFGCPARQEPSAGAVPGAAAPVPAAPHAPAHGASELGDTGSLQRQGSGADAPEPLPARLERIQHVLLQRADPELAAVLHAAGVAPEHFMLRWLRCLLTREIAQPQVLLVWDAVFARTPAAFTLVDAVCVALLTEPTVRQGVLAAADEVELRAAIKNIPSLADYQVALIVFKACQLFEEHQAAVANVRRQLTEQEERRRDCGYDNGGGGGGGGNDDGDYNDRKCLCINAASSTDSVPLFDSSALDYRAPATAATTAAAAQRLGGAVADPAAWVQDRLGELLRKARFRTNLD